MSLIFPDGSRTRSYGPGEKFPAPTPQPGFGKPKTSPFGPPQPAGNSQYPGGTSQQTNVAKPAGQAQSTPQPSKGTPYSAYAPNSSSSVATNTDGVNRTYNTNAYNNASSGNFGNNPTSRPPPVTQGATGLGGQSFSDPSQAFAQRDAMIDRLNTNKSQYTANAGVYQGDGPPPASFGQRPQYDFNSLMGQANDMVQQGWTNPFAQGSGGSDAGVERKGPGPNPFFTSSSPGAGGSGGQPSAYGQSMLSRPAVEAYYPGGPGGFPTQPAQGAPYQPPSQGTTQGIKRSPREIAGDFYDPNPGGPKLMVVSYFHNPQTGEEYGGTGIGPRPGTGWVAGKSPLAKLRDELSQAERDAAYPPRGWDDATRSVVEAPPGAAKQYAQRAENLRRQIAEMERNPAAPAPAAPPSPAPGSQPQRGRSADIRSPDEIAAEAKTKASQESPEWKAAVEASRPGRAQPIAQPQQGTPYAPASRPSEGATRTDPSTGKPVQYKNGQWSWEPNPISGPQPYDPSLFGDGPTQGTAPTTPQAGPAWSIPPQHRAEYSKYLESRGLRTMQYDPVRDRQEYEQWAASTGRVTGYNPGTPSVRPGGVVDRGRITDASQPGASSPGFDPRIHGYNPGMLDYQALPIARPSPPTGYNPGQPLRSADDSPTSPEYQKWRSGQAQTMEWRGPEGEAKREADMHRRWMEETGRAPASGDFRPKPGAPQGPRMPYAGGMDYEQGQPVVRPGLTLRPPTPTQYSKKLGRNLTAEEQADVDEGWRRTEAARDPAEQARRRKLFAEGAYYKPPPTPGRRL